MEAATSLPVWHSGRSLSSWTAGSNDFDPSCSCAAKESSGTKVPAALQDPQVDTFDNLLSTKVMLAAGIAALIERTNPHEACICFVDGRNQLVPVPDDSGVLCFGSTDSSADGEAQLVAPVDGRLSLAWPNTYSLRRGGVEVFELVTRDQALYMGGVRHSLMLSGRPPARQRPGAPAAEVEGAATCHVTLNGTANNAASFKKVDCTAAAVKASVAWGAAGGAEDKEEPAAAVCRLTLPGGACKAASFSSEWGTPVHLTVTKAVL